MKKIIAALLVLSVLLALAACADNKEIDDGSSEMTEVESVEETTYESFEEVALSDVFVIPSADF